MSYYAVNRSDRFGGADQAEREEQALLGQLLLKIELMRLADVGATGGGPSRAEALLTRENEILRGRLSTLRENIAVLNKMIDRVKGGDSHPRSVGLTVTSDPQLARVN